jgi:ATP synthase subunit D
MHRAVHVGAVPGPVLTRGAPWILNRVRTVTHGKQNESPSRRGPDETLKRLLAAEERLEARLEAARIAAASIIGEARRGEPHRGADTLRVLQDFGDAVSSQTRRLRTLEQRVAPQLAAQIRSVQSTLQEREREEYLRLKHLQRHQRRASAGS